MSKAFTPEEIRLMRETIEKVKDKLGRDLDDHEARMLSTMMVGLVEDGETDPDNLARLVMAKCSLSESGS